MAKRYFLYTLTNTEGVKKHSITAESAREAFNMLIERGYKADEISIAGFKGDVSL